MKTLNIFNKESINRLKPYLAVQYIINHENDAGHGKMLVRNI